MRIEFFESQADSAKISIATGGIVAGTEIMTMDGQLPVDVLAAGDRIITRDTGMAVLREVRVREMEIKTVDIKAGSLGHNRPDRNMQVARDTLIHIRDWRAEAMFGAPNALIPASQLVDGEFVAHGPSKKTTVFELVFDNQHIVYADGMEIASAAV